VELDFILPTGQYDNKYLINPGSNLWTIEPYYAFTWFLHSGVLHFLADPLHLQLEDDDPFVALGANDLQPGQAFHFNYSFDTSFTRISGERWRGTT